MLKDITPKFIDDLCKRHDADGGTEINNKISKVFKCFPDNTCRHDVRIKVAVLNTLYNTSIQYIDPVVASINTTFSRLKTGGLIADDPTDLVDLIATASWVSNASGSLHERTNLSFASKFMHFQSKRVIPVYDSYVWIVMTGYLRGVGERLTVGNPSRYADFHQRFDYFKKRFDLVKHSNYEIDKFLWQYGRQLISKIREELQVGIGDAKRELRRRLFYV
jgi:hypothetical protein